MIRDSEAVRVSKLGKKTENAIAYAASTVSQGNVWILLGIVVPGNVFLACHVTRHHYWSTRTTTKFPAGTLRVFGGHDQR